MLKLCKIRTNISRQRSYCIGKHSQRMFTRVRVLKSCLKEYYHRTDGFPAIRNFSLCLSSSWQPDGPKQFTRDRHTALPSVDGGGDRNGGGGGEIERNCRIIRLGARVPGGSGRSDPAIWRRVVDNLDSTELIGRILYYFVISCTEFRFITSHADMGIKK